jgi:hemerythrin-like domain-containing protein
MTSPALSRRLVIAGAAAALLPMREAIAQVRGGDWLPMVREHHRLIARSLQELVASTDRNFLQRDRLIRSIGYQLSAHSMAEENAIYPAMAMAGMKTASDRLYLDQGHAKVINAQLDLAARLNREGRDWTEHAQALLASVMRHVVEDEERDLFPQLHRRLNAQQNAVIGQTYARDFDLVRDPLRDV